MSQLTPERAVLKLWGGCLFVIAAWLVVGWIVVQLTPW